MKNTSSFFASAPQQTAVPSGRARPFWRGALAVLSFLAAALGATSLLGAPAIHLSDLSVEEATAAAQVGILSVTGGTPGATYVFSLDDTQAPNENHLFEIAGNVLRVKAGANLDFEDGANTHPVWIGATGGDTPILTSQRFDVTEVNINERPTLANQTFDLDENSTGTTFLTILAADPDDNTTFTFFIDTGVTSETRVQAKKRFESAPEEFTNEELQSYFAILPDGTLRISDDAVLNYETVEEITLTVRVRDNGIPENRSQFLESQPAATITLRLRDLWDYNPQTTIEVRSSNDRSWGVLPEPADEPGNDLLFTITDDNSPFRMADPTRPGEESGTLILVDAAAADLPNKGTVRVNIRITDSAPTPRAQPIAVTLRFTPDGENAPNGTPLLKQLAGNATSSLRPVTAIAHAPDGAVYVAGVQQSDSVTNGIITIFANSPLTGSLTQLPDTITIAPDFTPTAMAVSSGKIFVGGTKRISWIAGTTRINLQRRYVFALPLNDLANAAARQFAALDGPDTEQDDSKHGSITDLKVATVLVGGQPVEKVFVCGNVGSDNRNYWQELRTDLTYGAADRRTWGWERASNPIFPVDFTVANGAATALAVDTAGNVYVGGYWEDPGPRGIDSKPQDVREFVFEHSLYGAPGIPKSLLPEYSDRRHFFRFWSDFRADDAKSTRSAYIVKFSRIQAFGPNHFNATAYAQDTNRNTVSFIRGLQIVNVSGNERLYAIQEFKGAGALGGATPSHGWTDPKKSDQLNYDIKINRFDLSLEPVFPQNALIQGSGNEVVKSFTTDHEGNIYVVGIAEGAKTARLLNGATAATSAPSGGPPDPINPGRNAFFAAKLTSSFTWDWNGARLFAGDYSPDSALVSWYPTAGGVLVAGNIFSGLLTVTKDEENNHVKADAGKNAGFLTLLGGADGEPLGRIFLEIESRFGRSGIEVMPWLGPRPAQVGKSYTISVPEVIYLDAQRRVLPQTASNEDIETMAVTRAICTGYTLSDTGVTGSSTNFTFTFTGNSKITFHWKVEHALVIANDLQGTGASFTGVAPGPGVLSGVLSRLAYNQRVHWTRGDNNAGSTNPGLGNPTPAAEKHWVAEGTRRQAAIDGIVPDFGRPGFRYTVTGYELRFPGGNSEKNWDAEASKQQTDPFYMSEPQAVTWKWKVQIRIQATTTSERTKGFPRIVVGNPGAEECFPGWEERWRDRDSKVIIGALVEGAIGNGRTKTLSGWISATGQILASHQSSGQDSELAPFSFCNQTIHGLQIDQLREPASIVFSYETTLYHEAALIGNAVQFTGTSTQGTFPKTLVTEDGTASGLVKKPARFRLGQGPPGSTDDNVQVWDEVVHTSYPTRPGIYFLEWQSPGEEDPIILQVNSDWGSSHFRHLAHDEMPPVVLDPVPDDQFWFKGMPFSDSDGDVLNGGFSARFPGRHVLVFSQSTQPERPATGDLTREILLVRTVETRAWNEAAISGTPASAGVSKGRWDNPAKAMIVGLGDTETPRVVEIGRKVTSTPGAHEGNLDRAGLKTGFVVHPNARYNADIYDRTSAASSGPIIPVNLEFTHQQTNQLFIVWYEHASTDGTEPDNLLWPYQSEQVNPVWPAKSYLTVLRQPDGVDVFDQPLDRIVIASRLGSEGRNWNHQVQTTFSLDRYDQVGIYHQPDRNRPGYNPNEEHAVIAPSFKRLDLPTPPPTAFALRNDLNVSQARIETDPLPAGDPNKLTLAQHYTSDPYVLVEYFDKADNEFKMNVYAVEKEDPAPDLNAYRYPEMEADRRDLGIIHADIVAAGLTLQTLGNWVIGDYATLSEMEAARTAARVDLQSHPGLPPALAAQAIADYFVSRDPAQDQPDAQLIAALEAELALAEKSNAEQYHSQFDETLRAIYRAVNRLKAQQRKFPYTFRYEMKAGEPVLPPYPLPLVIGLTPCPETSGQNPADQRVYWEDHKGGPWAVSQGTFSNTVYYPLLTFFWEGEGANAKVVGECVRFVTEGEDILVGRTANPTFTAGSTLTIRSNNVPFNVALTGTDVAAFLSAVNTAVPTIDARQLISGQIQLQSKRPIALALADGVGQPLKKAGFLLGDSQTEVSEGGSKFITYDSAWPEVLPILKAGETLTFAGGEYKGDHPGPEQPGLPGVLNWASGRIIYDTLNRNMTNQWAFDAYTAQLISPLEERAVDLKEIGLTEAQIQEFREAIQPAKGLTKVVGVRWHFVDLPPSLAKRIFFDPFSNRLGLKGFLNDKTLGDSSLTAAPPPIYVLELNILSNREREFLLESEKLDKIKSLAAWRAAVPTLYALSRNPQKLARIPLDSDPYYPGLEMDVEPDAGGADRRDDLGNLVTIPFTARPRNTLGPGLALVPSSRFLDPESGAADVSYVTLVENDDETIGGPITVHIIKVERKHRFRGAIKTILSDNVFDEKITLRHTGDFGANGDEIVYQWFYREENGAPAPLPRPGDGSWQLFADQSANDVKGLGMHQISLDGSGGLLLADNLFFVRYRHLRDKPFNDPLQQNSDDWGAPRLANDAGNPVPPFTPNASAPGSPPDFGTAWNRDGAPFRDPLHKEQGKLNPSNPLRFGGEWAGAANSPTVDLEYRAQLVMGWIKRVLDRVNPYEARIEDFRNNESPATYASMIQQAGQPYAGPVALNPDKNVVENVGLIELYQTLLDRGINLSIGLSSPLTTPGINNALLLAMTRISDLYMVLANEAYMDALDPTIGFGSSSVEYGSLAPAIFSFQNQLPSLLDEELALLRGIDDDRRRPMHNRLFWNFTKGEGEVAYAMNYNLADVNQDGFINESDALIQYPQGHGDAWGHYLTALKTRYRLLRHPFFNWQTRSEFYNLLDVVIGVDFLDERKFVEVAAAKAQAGAEIVNDTYRSRYVEDPDGQWQGYTDPIPGRDWGVAEWARRAGQGALFDWMTANALIPPEETDPRKEGIQKIDRSTVTDIAKISANLGAIQTTYDGANTGLNPLGLNSDIVPFDIDPTAGTVQSLTHFEQIFERAFAALRNAQVAFDHANENKNRLRQVANSVENLRQDVISEDTELRNRLIEIFGTPYEGTIGTGKPYPAGYKGPDLSLYMYVDVNDITAANVPSAAPAYYQARIQAFESDLQGINGRFQDLFQEDFLKDLQNNLKSWTTVILTDNSVLDLKLPATASQYGFQVQPEWGWGKRAAPGRLQTLISDMLQAQADLGLAVGDYDYLWVQITDAVKLLEAKNNVLSENLSVKEFARDTLKGLTAGVVTTRKITEFTQLILSAITAVGEVASKALDTWVIAGFSNGSNSPGTQTAAASLESAQQSKVEAEAAGQKSIAEAQSLSAKASATKAAQAANSKAQAKVLQAEKNVVNQKKVDKLTVLKSSADTHAAVTRSVGDLGGSAVDLLSDIPELVIANIKAAQEVELEEAIARLELVERIKELEHLLVNDGTVRVKVFSLLERLRSVGDQYRAALDQGVRLVEQRRSFNTKTAAATQMNRYQDMAFRVSRNHALEKYRPAFDIAQRYVYMAAKAYEYETNLSPDHRGSAQPLLTEIVRQRSLGQLTFYEPMHGPGGLAGVMALLRDNFNVLKGQLGLNNPQLEVNQFSLRKELFGLSLQVQSDKAPWAAILQNARRDNLWDVPEFRRYCRPFDNFDPAQPEPGLVLRFSTTVRAGMNFFGRDLAAGDSAYDPSNYATRIAAAAVKFDGYDPGRLAATPRVYLVPIGLDVLYYPDSRQLRLRDWNIVDQRIPVPFQTGRSDLNDPDWIPVIDSLSGPLGEIRRHAGFRAVAGRVGDPALDAQIYDARLTARSVWNTGWLLIIPGRHLFHDPAEGVTRFINDVQDIAITLKTYGNAGF